MQSRKDFQKAQKTKAKQTKKTPDSEVNGIWLDQSGKPMLRQPNMKWWENIKFQWNYRKEHRNGRRFNFPIFDRIRFAYEDIGGLGAVGLMYIILMVIIGIENRALDASHTAQAGISKTIANEFGNGDMFDPRWMQGFFDWSFYSTVPPDRMIVAYFAIAYWIGMFIFFPFVITLFEWYFKTLSVLFGMLTRVTMFLVFIPIIGWAILLISWAGILSGGWIALCIIIEGAPLFGLIVFIKKITCEVNP